MRLIKLAFISFIFLFIVVLGISLFIPSHVRISRALQVNGNRDKLRAALVSPANWQQWMPGMDTAVILYVEGKVAGLTFNRVKDQSLVLKHVSPDSIVAKYLNLNRNELLTGWNLVPSQADSSTTVQWYMDFQLDWYPWEKFSSLLFEKQYGTQLEKGLHDLKEWVENN